MALKIAINGFGRIGRLVFRAISEQGLIGKDVEIVAVGDIVPADNLAYLLKYDSTQGLFKGEVSSKKSSADKAEDDVLVVNGREMALGLFAIGEQAKGHLAAGAKKVIISAPAKNEDI